MFDKVQLIIHHGGTFVQRPKTMYKGGGVDCVEIDPDLICYPHLMKCLRSGRYGNIQGLYFKRPHDPMGELYELFDDKTTLHLIHLASHCGKIEVFVEHDLDEVELVDLLLVPNEPFEPHPQDETPATHAESRKAVDVDCAEGEQNGNEEELCDLRDENDQEMPQVNESEQDGSEDGESEHYMDSEAESDGGNGYKKSVLHSSYNPESEPPLIELAMLFEDGRQFKNAIIRYACHEKKDVYFKKKNEPMRVRVKCAKNCPFTCMASWEHRLRCFQVKVLNPIHLCNTKFKLRIVSQNWIADRYEENVLENPSIGATELKNLIKADLKINVSISMVTRALKEIKVKTETAFKDQFKKLGDYAQECLNSFPNNTVVIHTVRVVPDAPPVFQRIYICFGPVKRGFLDGCRKVIGLDGCFLKVQLKGEILTAVGRDANNQMYPIAWVVVEIENSSSWTWFLELLKKDLEITTAESWTLISDQQKGLSNVISHVFSGAEHRKCARHIHANWSKKHGGVVLRRHFWACAKSPNEPLLHRTLDDLRKLDLEAAQDLEKYPFKL
ncbi:unnamed protein product [Cuscuta europaea]|uniref:MULE transposase domain-containing protein n=1 Tax=Cuscuta europaea TaxID=41803 RepID=A0A9P1EME0_CUSEU|nr:unnamed protein product [Cuscuta europaea]